MIISVRNTRWMKKHIPSWTDSGENTQNAYTYTHAHTSDVFQLAASVHAYYAPHPARSGTTTFPMTSVNPSTSLQSHTSCTLSVFPVHKTTSVLSNVKCPVYLYSFKLCNICKTILLNSLDSLKNTYIYIYIYIYIQLYQILVMAKEIS